jgi:uncharacterized membrane protein
MLLSTWKVTADQCLHEAVSTQKGIKTMTGYGNYSGMMDGFGWVWMVFLLAVVIALVVWGTRTSVWSRRDSRESAPLDTLRQRYAAGEITASEFEHAKQLIA